jgi:gliding motility-associated-like protein
MAQVYKAFFFTLLLALCLINRGFGQTLQVTSTTQPTCTAANTGEFTVELIDTTTTVVFVLNAAPSGSPPYVQNDTTDLKVITYSALSEGNYFVNVFRPGGGSIAPGVFVALDINEPVIDVPAVPEIVCSNDGPQDLTALVSANQPGGTFTFSGPGVTGNVFDPAGLSGFENITATYTLGVCVVSNVLTFDIEPAPVIITLPLTLCEDESPIDLVPLVTANIPGGSFSFSGPGVSGDFFDPSGLSGPVAIDVTYVLGNCTVNNVMNVTVQELPVLTLTPTNVCENSVAVDLTTLVSANPGGGTFSFSGSGVSGNSFDPTGLGGSTVNVDVTYTNGTCTELGVLSITVDNPPSITTNPNSPVCENAGPQNLLTMVSASPAGGSFTFAGPGVSGTDLDPTGLGGTSANIDVTYTLGNCVVTEVMTIDIEAAAVLTLNPVTPVCENATPLDLTTMVSANPAGGIFGFAGPGVSGNNFNPSGLGGTTANIDVSYALGACTVMGTMTIDIQATPVLTLNPVTPMCENAGPQNLLTMVSASPAGGTYSFTGPGVTATSFDPAGLSGTVNIDVTYDLGSCQVTSTMALDIEPTPVLTLTPVTPQCDANMPVDLLTWVSANPGGGTFSFSGPGVSGNTFDPMGQSGIVNIVVEYQLSACTVTEVITIEVEQAPSMVLAPNTPLCQNAGPQDLFSWVTPNPPGGTFTFSGPGVTGDTFDPIGLSGFVAINVEYALGVCTTSNTMSVDVQIIPNITLTPPAAICNDQGSLNLLSLVTVNPTGGTLTFSGPGVAGNTFDPTGLSGTIDIDVNYSLTFCSSTQVMQLVVNDAATVSAGVDQIICETDLVTLSGVIGGGATSATWASTGTGTFDDNTNLNTTYTPSAADIAAGNVALTLITDDPDGPGPCSVQSSALTVTINPAAIADAGPDQTVCEGSDVTIAGSVSGAALNPVWSTLGGGTFDDPTDLSTTYFPDGTDVSAGMVQLVLTTDDPDGPGGCNAASDTVEIVINMLPTVDAGNDQAIAAGNTVNLSGTLGGGANSGTWSSNGSGAFDDVNSLNTFYTPSAADILAGSVILILTTDDPDGPGPCTAQSDLMTVLIVTGNTVIAGVDQNICEGDTVFLSGVAACVNNGTTWTTDGTGSFDDTNVLNTYYLPSANDIAADSILIILSIDDPASSLGCLPQSDTMVVKINPTPVANAGTNVTICQGDAVQLTGSGAAFYQWSPSAGLSDPNIPDPMASPNTTTTYVLTVIDDFGCTDTASVTVNVTITDPPAVVSPVTICQDFVSPRLTASGTSINWYTDAALTNLVASGPEYQPGPAELDVTAVGSTTFYATQDIGCGESSAASVVVNVLDRNDPLCNTLCPTVDFTASVTDVICAGSDTGIIQLDNITGTTSSSPMLDVLLDGSLVGQTDQNQFTITDLATGTYTVTVQQTGVCLNSFDQTVTIAAPASSISASVRDVSISLPDLPTGEFTVNITGTSGTAPYQVSIELITPAFPPQSIFVDFMPAVEDPVSGDYQIIFTDLYAGVYEIIVRDTAGCSITINQEVGYDDSIFVPNIFTPNDDGVNETFTIRNLPTDGNIAMVISNRWGKVVFETPDYQNNWDGGDNSDGTYFYRIKINEVIYNGWVEIRRGDVP